ncbi:MAG: RHS repeat-associated core domain-containing protein [Planctomycetota bacterium]|nr:MAG: RHS repeat-associated core domain-containing protein [Planctomycetota bacterium]
MHDSTNGETTVYHVDPRNLTGYAQVLEEGVDAGADGRLDAAEIAKTYTLGHDVVAQQGPDIAGGEPLFFVYDGHGSTRALADADAAVLQRFAYDAYGNMQTGPGVTQEIANAFTSFLYSGEKTDPTGLHYLRNRYLDPLTGRFLTLDAYAGNVQDPLSLHKYLYAHANPVMGIDPLGLSVEFDAPKGILAHQVFTEYVSATRGVDARLVGATLRNVVGLTGPEGSLKPDFVDTRAMEYFELKPASHTHSQPLQSADYYGQLFFYDAALRPTYRRGDSAGLIPYRHGGYPLGVFTDELGDTYLVKGWPEERGRLEAGHPGAGLLYYRLTKLDDTPIPPLWVTEGSRPNQEGVKVFRDEYRHHVELHFEFRIAASTALKGAAFVSTALATGLAARALVSTATVGLGFAI